MKIKIKKFIRNIFLIVGFSLYFSCNSPLEVPANREITLKENPYSNPMIKFSPNYLNFDFVHPDSSKILTLTIENNQANSYPLTEYHLFFGSNNFKILNKTIPVILESKGTSGSSFEIKIQFTGKSSGTFNDSLLVNNLSYPKAIFEAKVPNIYANDIFLGEFLINEIKTGKIIFKNNSSNPVKINKIKLSQNTEFFNFIDTFPIEVSRNTSKEIIFNFESNTKGNFSSNLIYEIETLSLKNLIDSISRVTAICN
jgi:hypothetical protein